MPPRSKRARRPASGETEGDAKRPRTADDETSEEEGELLDSSPALVSREAPRAVDDDDVESAATRRARRADTAAAAPPAAAAPRAAAGRAAPAPRAVRSPAPATKYADAARAEHRAAIAAATSTEPRRGEPAAPPEDARGSIHEALAVAAAPAAAAAAPAAAAAAPAAAAAAPAAAAAAPAAAARPVAVVKSVAGADSTPRRAAACLAVLLLGCASRSLSASVDRSSTSRVASYNAHLRHELRNHEWWGALELTKQAEAELAHGSSQFRAVLARLEALSAPPRDSAPNDADAGAAADDEARAEAAAAALERTAADLEALKVSALAAEWAGVEAKAAAARTRLDAAGVEADALLPDAAVAVSGAAAAAGDFVRSSVQASLGLVSASALEPLEKFLGAEALRAAQGAKARAAIDPAVVISRKLAEFERHRSGSFNYASSRTGATIVARNTSADYATTLPLRYRARHVFGIDDFGRPPAIILSANDDGVPAKSCWAFTGESGEVTIKLASPTIPTAFALEHVAASISDRPGAAPRAVEVFGYSDLASDSEYKLGSFDFDLKKGPLQRFHATPPPEKIAFVKLKVHSNHGFGAFTCLYRFAVF